MGLQAKVKRISCAFFVLACLYASHGADVLLTPYDPAVAQGNFFKLYERFSSWTTYCLEYNSNFNSVDYGPIASWPRVYWMLIPSARNDSLTESLRSTKAYFYVINKSTGKAMSPKSGLSGNCEDIGLTTPCIRTYEINSTVSSSVVSRCEWQFSHQGDSTYTIQNVPISKCVQKRACGSTGLYEMKLWTCGGGVSTCEVWAAVAAGTITGIPVPYSNDIPVPMAPEMDSLNDFYTLPQESDPAVVGMTVLPFIEVNDPSLTPAEQVNITPFYQIERSYLWVREAAGMGDAGVSHDLQVEVTEGASTQSRETITQSTGWKITASLGFSFKSILSAGLKKEITSNLKVQSTADTTQLTLKTITRTYHLTGETDYAYALWTLVNRYMLLRMDGKDTVAVWDVYSEMHDFDLCTQGSSIEGGRQDPFIPGMTAEKKYQTILYYDITGRRIPGEAIQQRHYVGIYFYRDFDGKFKKGLIIK